MFALNAGLLADEIYVTVYSLVQSIMHVISHSITLIIMNITKGDK